MFSAQTLTRDLEKIRRQAPLVHNITNFVVMNLTANALLSIGASPVMAHALEEVEDMVNLASAVVINIGTLSRHWVEAMVKAIRAADRKKIPVILDPVGSGATAYRTATARELLAAGPVAIIRGNGSEIRSLVDSEARTKGVDSLEGPESAVEAGRLLSQKYGCAVSISGPVDIVVRGQETVRIANGHPLMPRVTGLGCTASALTGAFAAVNPDPLEAAAEAMAIMGICGELAAEKARGPASFELHFLDWLYQVGELEITERLKYESHQAS
ncbi:MAG: hydroxyethylthiazole kinase [Candidatus Saccharicenans sp.]|jgi:hydroxyethylthiazole kinase|nr:hydroxyethylthiazole kinase [Candidatus Saccharicenans sp.]MDH7493150.1 hydroxyethylthiazole kinase [Candidatus Saccharicenans sp.]